MRWWTLISLTVLFVTLKETAGSKILFISAVGSKSHKGFFTHVSNKLADHGHHVTLVSPYKPSKVRDNIREVVLEGLELAKILPNMFEESQIEGPRKLLSLTPAMCAEALGRKEVQDLLQEEFDVGLITIFMSDCFFSLFHQMKIPYIQVCPAGLAGLVGSTLGNPPFPSFVNSPMLPNFHPFTFKERLMNALADTVSTAIMDHVVPSRMDDECRQRGLCPATMPSLLELKRNSSIMLVNSVRSMETPPRPVVPSIIHIGGIHCQDAKPLPKDLEEWVAGAGEEGFIFFSLGSVVKPSSMLEEYRQVLVKTFASLKQRVLWKWDEDTMKDLPPNVRLGKWLPQQDILGDSRLRVFITHGGALSTQESIFHGTPVIGLPVFADQMTNMMDVQHQGWGRALKWKELTEEHLGSTIHTVMTDNKMRAEVKRRSSLMRDQPMSPDKVANYWVDYVIRHKGAQHLKSPILSMEWYQVYNVDVWLTVLAIAIIAICIIVKILLMVCRCLCSSKKKSKKD